MHPEAFKVFGFSIYWYGIFAAIGFLTAFRSGSRRAPREGIPGEAIMNLAPWIIGGAIIGARILYVINYWDREFAGKPLYYIITIGRSGLVFYGGLIGSSLGTIIYCWKNKYPLWKVSDIMAPCISLGHAFGRIGCLMTGCCFGRACSMPWAVHFPLEHETKGNPVHPTQIYESVLLFLLSGFLAWLFGRKKFDGQVFASYLMGYAILRAIVESFRGDYSQHQYMGGIASPGQVVSIVMFTLGLALWIWRNGKGVAPRPTIAPVQTHG